MSDNNNQLQPFLAMVNLPHVEVAKQIIEQVKEGNVDPVQCMIAIKRMEQVVAQTIGSEKGDKELREIFKTAVTKALDGGKSVDMFGANLRIQATGTYYDFEPCKDSVLNELLKIQKEVNDAVTKRKEDIKQLLPPDDVTSLGIRCKKVIQEGIPVFSWTEDEFEETIFPPIKGAGSSVIVTFKNKK